ncbi:MAG: acyloxyacyl hydrolase [Phycisphaerales bacterium]
MNWNMLKAAGLCSVLAGSSLAPAAEERVELDRAAPLTVDMSGAYAQDPVKRDDPAAPAEPLPRFGHTGGWWLTVGGGVANDFGEETDYNLHVAASTFIARDLEFAVELSAWYFAQDGEDTGGVNPNMIFRWHFLHDEAYSWTIYGDAGIGLLFAFDDVPSQGTSFDFTPRVGGGATFDLGDDVRLQVGVRYHHISNGRIQGDDQNPGRDSIMFYLGVVFPL